MRQWTVFTARPEANSVVGTLVDIRTTISVLTIIYIDIIAKTKQDQLLPTYNKMDRLISIE